MMVGLQQVGVGLQQSTQPNITNGPFAPTGKPLRPTHQGRKGFCTTCGFHSIIHDSSIQMKKRLWLLTEDMCSTSQNKYFHSSYIALRVKTKIVKTSPFDPVLPYSFTVTDPYVSKHLGRVEALGHDVENQWFKALKIHHFQPYNWSSLKLSIRWHHLCLLTLCLRGGLWTVQKPAYQ